MTWCPFDLIQSIFTKYFSMTSSLYQKSNAEPRTSEVHTAVRKAEEKQTKIKTMNVNQQHSSTPKTHPTQTQKAEKLHATLSNEGNVSTKEPKEKNDSNDPEVLESLLVGFNLARIKSTL